MGLRVVGLFGTYSKTSVAAVIVVVVVVAAAAVVRLLRPFDLNTPSEAQLSPRSDPGRAPGLGRSPRNLDSQGFRVVNAEFRLGVYRFTCLRA